GRGPGRGMLPAPLAEKAAMAARLRYAIARRFFCAYFASLLAVDSAHAFPTGTVDPTFGQFGVASIPQFRGAAALAVQPDGKVLVAGTDLSQGAAISFAIARLTSTGLPDAAFGTRGVATSPLSSFAAVSALAVQSDGRIIAAGSASGLVGSDPVNSMLVLVRFTASGQVDSSYGSDGIATTSILPATPSFYQFVLVGGVALQPDGKAV